MVHYRVVVDITGATQEQWEAALASIESLQEELSFEGIEIHGLVHSHAWPLLTRPEKGGEATLHARAQALAQAGVRLTLCQNTLRGAKLAKRDLLPFATTITSAVGELVRKQTEGWAYFKPS